MVLKRKQLAFGFVLLALSALTVPVVALSNAPRAELVMQTNDPWRMVIGSDSPEFALYADGTVIFLRESVGEEKPPHYYTVHITEDERTSLLQQAKGGLANKKPNYRVVNATDQPLSTVALPPLNYQTVSVYGNPFKPTSHLGKADSLPGDLFALMKRLRDFDSNDATQWLPEKVEVMFWPFEYAKGKPVVWPKGWPDLNSSDTVKRQTDSYSVFLPSADFPKLRTITRTRPNKSPISINGKLMAISYRFPFPDQMGIRISLMQKPQPRTKPSKSF